VTVPKLSNKRLSNTEGSVLDPIVAIRRTLTLSPDESASVQIISGVADTREAALALLEKYCDRHFVERAFEMAWFQSQEVLRHLNATEADAQVYGRLASSVIYGNALRRAAPSIIARNQLGQSGLWRFAISGDLPIVLLHIGDLNRIDLVKQVLQAHAYWRMKGLAADLVIVNEDFSGYRAVLQDQIMGLINAGPEAQVIDKPGGVFVRRAEELSEDERVLLQTVARIVFSDTAETLIEQVERRVSAERASDRLEPVSQAAASRSIRWRRANAFSATAWAASRPTGTNTSSPSNPVRPRRRRGSMSSPARTSARSSARAAARTPGWKTRTSSG
jgi:cyclic beta-1,2-glucan synthetase